jgi:hypothetical protein
LGVLLLKRAYDEIQQEQEDERKLLETWLVSSATSNATTSPQLPTRSSLTHLHNTTELWQEILYLPQYEQTIFSHVPPPRWGYTRRACKFVVVVPPPTTTTNELQSYGIDGQDQGGHDQDHEEKVVAPAVGDERLSLPKLIVPMYSRIAGSRMCPKQS